MENKITFRCLRSGNTVSFSNESDIQSTRDHEGYEEVLPEAIIVADVEEVQATPKRRGRPKLNK
tara:strand:- start:38 stop:229 length:192 start_codon:yes stop_codon:yes gene_type:complete